MLQLSGEASRATGSGAPEGVRFRVIGVLLGSSDIFQFIAGPACKAGVPEVPTCMYFKAYTANAGP
jgi:hypothetical protein